MQNLKKIMNSVEQGILVCDEEGRIEFFNDSYGEFVGRRLEEVKGMYLTELRPGAVAPSVLKTGEPIRSMHRRENDKDYFADIYPIKVNGNNVGTVSIVTYVAPTT